METGDAVVARGDGVEVESLNDIAHRGATAGHDGTESLNEVFGETADDAPGHGSLTFGAAGVLTGLQAGEGLLKGGKLAARDSEGGGVALGKGDLDVFEEGLTDRIVLDDEDHVAVRILLRAHAGVDSPEGFIGEGVIHHFDAVEINGQDATRRQRAEGGIERLLNLAPEWAHRQKFPKFPQRPFFDVLHP